MSADFTVVFDLTSLQPEQAWEAFKCAALRWSGSPVDRWDRMAWHGEHLGYLLAAGSTTAASDRIPDEVLHWPAFRRSIATDFGYLQVALWPTAAPGQLATALAGGGGLYERLEEEPHLTASFCEMLVEIANGLYTDFFFLERDGGTGPVRWPRLKLSCIRSGRPYCLEDRNELWQRVVQSNPPTWQDASHSRLSEFDIVSNSVVGLALDDLLV